MSNQVRPDLVFNNREAIKLLLAIVESQEYQLLVSKDFFHSILVTKTLPLKEAAEKVYYIRTVMLCGNYLRSMTVYPSRHLLVPSQPWKQQSNV